MANPRPRRARIIAGNAQRAAVSTRQIPQPNTMPMPTNPCTKSGRENQKNPPASTAVPMICHTAGLLFFRIFFSRIFFSPFS